jgi:hypothetical protein
MMLNQQMKYSSSLFSVLVASCAFHDANAGLTMKAAKDPTEQIEAIRLM